MQKKKNRLIRMSEIETEQVRCCAIRSSPMVKSLSSRATQGSELLHLFIERIEVGERGERYSRTAEQKIIIRYRDIGVLEAFAEEARKIAV